MESKESIRKSMTNEQTTSVCRNSIRNDQKRMCAFSLLESNLDLKRANDISLVATNLDNGTGIAFQMEESIPFDWLEFTSSGQDYKRWIIGIKFSSL